MITKNIIRSILLVVALGCLAIWANREFQKHKAAEQEPPAETLPAVEGPQVVVSYFLIGERCPSCKTIEALTEETVEMDFPAELSSHKVIFRVMDTAEPANRHYLADYKLKSKTVVISRRMGGRETSWKDMAKVWDLLDDGPAFHAYIGDQIREDLKP